MAALPVEIVYGIYLGILAGIIPALIAGALGFVFKYFTDVSIPGFGVVVLALAIAGVNGGLLALNDKAITQAEHNVAIVVAIIVVLMLTLYAHAQGDKLGEQLPKRITLKKITERTLSTDVVELVGGRGQVRVTVAGEVADVEGYPPMPTELRAELQDGEWTFPADVPLTELETRLADRLRNDHDLAEVSVRLDERARATIAAAPPVGGLSKRVPAGKRAVSVDTLVPTGVARGDVVDLVTPEETVTGTVLSVKSTEKKAKNAKDEPGESGVATDGGTDDATTEPPEPLATTAGGEGRVTVVVDRPAAKTVLAAPATQVVVQARGTRREFELTTLLRRGGRRFRRVSVKAGGLLDGITIGEASVRDTYDVGVLAVRHDTWQFAPPESTELSAGDELFVVGTRGALDAFAEVAA
ncbi:TrkA-C domain-containing protein [Halogranum amylolyticum]|uniref:TrkA-C domain-containing protein n=1 Tax=Halogranum amylolyticum TaxID=660520 RepID=A0A1H8N620_9EURY|nr:TrkA C-terminal domain-containing protein [Halogranum amylolyticum]SEO25057.1 TrkA-C domain-containing protein [Halogranum amylolyticum]